MGRKSWTKSEVYGGAMTSRTYGDDGRSLPRTAEGGLAGSWEKPPPGPVGFPLTAVTMIRPPEGT